MKGINTITARKLNKRNFTQEVIERNFIRVIANVNEIDIEGYDSAEVIKAEHYLTKCIMDILDDMRNQPCKYKIAVYDSCDKNSAKILKILKPVNSFFKFLFKFSYGN